MPPFPWDHLGRPHCLCRICQRLCATNLRKHGVRAMTPRLSPTITMLLIGAGCGLAGCSEGSSLSTSSIFGGGNSAAAAAPAGPTAPVSTPASRALQVGGTAARATKCGYNFDANKLRSNFLAAEATQAPGADQVTTQKTYDTAFAGVTKAAASQPGYCSEAKTRDIKADLTRHLAGDYSPSPPKQVVQEEGGIFDGFGSSSSSSEYKQTMPTDNRND